MAEIFGEMIQSIIKLYYLEFEVLGFRMSFMGIIIYGILIPVIFYFFFKIFD